MTTQPCAATAWKKHGIVVEGTEPWEGGFIQDFNSSAEPLGDGRWRLWYGVNQPDEAFKTVAFAQGVPGHQMRKVRAVLSAGEPADAPLAIGNLPDGWEPVQPVHLKLHDGRQRLYFWAHELKRGPVQRFLAADSDDGRRYRVVDPHRPCLYSTFDQAVRGDGVSPWGLRYHEFSRQPRVADEPDASPDLITNDGATVYQLPDGSFELFAQTIVSLDPGDPRVVAHDNLAGFVRVIDRLTSADGLRWGNRQRVLTQDAGDPEDLQFYYHTVTHTDRGRVGLLGEYHVQEQYMEMTWCFSDDGIHWNRPLRKPWLPRGVPGEGDSYGVYPPRAIVEHAGQWWLFYTGVNYSHNQADSHGQKRSCLMLATTPSIWA